jgi:hypothetical protein
VLFIQIKILYLHIKLLEIMITLSKIHKDYIEQLIKENEKIQRVISYAKGAGFNTDSYSSPIHIEGNKLTIRYRRENKYYFLNK